MEDGSGGGKPGAKDEIESQGVGAEAVTRWQSLGPGAGEEGAGECQSLRKGFKGEEKDGSHSSKIDGAGGADHGQEDEEAPMSK